MEAQPRDVAREALEGRIIGGDLPASRRLDEQRLAGDLGVDRAAIREALACLERDGLARADGDGFVVAPLDGAWLREPYPVALLLEGLAVRSAPALPERALDRLREINDGSASSGRPTRAWPPSATWTSTTSSWRRAATSTCSRPSGR